MQHRAQGQWRYLGELCLLYNNFDSDGLENLTRGDWPNLRCVQLDLILGNAATWRVLDLDPHRVSDIKAKVKEDENSVGDVVKVPRLVKCSKKFWPAMQGYSIQ